MTGTLDGYERDDPHFERDLEESHVAVWKVARWFSGRGYDIKIPATKVRPTVEEMSEYADDGDLWVSNGETEGWVGVKRRTFDFTTRESYPYPTVFVENVHIWERADPKPIGYIILNTTRTHAAIVLAETFQLWVEVTRRDRQRGRDRTLYECPKGRAVFVSLG